MSQIITQIRDDVCVMLSDGSLHPPLKPLALYDITFNLKDLSEGRLAVMPQAKTPTLISRGAAQKMEVKIDVCVQYKFAQPTQTELDPYQELSEQIIDKFIGKSLPSGPTCVEAAYPHGLFLHEHIKEFRVFTSVVTLTFLFAQ